MKIRTIALISCAIAIMGCALWVFYGQTNQSQAPKSQTSPPKANPVDVEILPQPLPPKELEIGLLPGSGDDHIAALEVIMGWLREQKVLTNEDQALMLAYLQQEQPKSMTSGEWEVQVNEILNFLRAQPKGVPGLADLMLHMAENDPNSVMRMYAMQHIFLWIPDEPSEEKREAMMVYLRRVAESPEDMHAGAAVMFLSDLEIREGQKGDVSDDATISRAALRLVENTEVNPAARISALHTCTERRVTDALPVARKIANDESQMIPLRKAAIHCIGQMGGGEDIEMLESLAKATSSLKGATSPAIKRLQQ